VDVLLIRFPVALQKFPQGGGVFMPHVFSSLSVVAAIIAYVLAFFTLPAKKIAPLAESGAILETKANNFCDIALICSKILYQYPHYY
jgi:hypothetical protein